MLSLTPAQLDAQSPVLVENWIDIESPELEEKDDMPWLTRKWLKMGLSGYANNPPFFHTDLIGRVWFKNPDHPNAPYVPHSFTYEGKQYGVRVISAAPN